MATNQQRWVRNVLGASEPFVYLGKFQAGSTQAVKRGELIEFTGDTNTAWVPLDSNDARTADLAIANEEIKAGYRAGYYEVIVPRPGDIFEYDIATAAATAYGTALYYSSSEQFTASASGSQMAIAVGQEHYPAKQGHLGDDIEGDAGTTIRSTSKVYVAIKASCSLWAKLFA